MILFARDLRAFFTQSIPYLPKCSIIIQSSVVSIDVREPIDKGVEDVYIALPLACGMDGS